MLFLPRGNYDSDAPMERYLNADMTGGTKSVDAQCVAGLQCREPQRAKSDDPGAEQWCRSESTKRIRDRVDELLGRDDVLGVAAVNRPSGVGRIRTQILFSASTELTSPASTVQPGNSYTFSHRIFPRGRATANYLANYLMSRYDLRQLRC